MMLRRFVPLGVLLFACGSAACSSTGGDTTADTSPPPADTADSTVDTEPIDTGDETVDSGDDAGETTVPPDGGDSTVPDGDSGATEVGDTLPDLGGETDTGPAKCTKPGVVEKDIDCGKCGKTDRICLDGVWSYGPCVGELDCYPGTTRTNKCGTMCGTQTEKCDPTCAWVAVGACIPAGVCTPGTSETKYGACSADVLVTTKRDCLSSCTLGDWTPKC